MSDSPLSTRLSGYHDFGGLASLRGDAAQGQGSAIRETAKQFEAYFLQTIMKTMREGIERSDLVDSGHSDTFQDMMDKEIAVKMADRGAIGLADMIERSVAQRGLPTAHEALSAREKAWPPAAAGPLSLRAQQAGGLPLPPAQGALPLKPRVKVEGAGDE